MADNFFDGTLDDFFLDDQSLIELANLTLPLASPPPHTPLNNSPVRLLPLEGWSNPSPRVRFDYEQGHTLPFGPILRDRAAQSSTVPGLGFDSGSTRADASHRPTPAASQQQSKLSRLNPSPDNLFVQNRNSIQQNLPARSASTTAPLNLTRSAFDPSLPLHGLPIVSATPNVYQGCSGSTSWSENNRPSPPDLRISRHSAQSPSKITPATPHIDSTPARPLASHCLRFESTESSHNYRSDNTSLGSSTMSSATRNRSLRPGELTLPLAPSQPAPSSRSLAITPTRGSTSQFLQPGKTDLTNKRKREEEDDDDLFGDNVFAGQEVVDLVDNDDLPVESLDSQERDKNYIKLGAFDCVICMDSVTDLTVTHCGHLFCSQCLHSALNMNPTKRVCPICRQKIDKTPASGHFGLRAKGYYPLELKLMTKRMLGRSSQQSSGAAT